MAEFVLFATLMLIPLLLAGAVFYFLIQAVLRMGSRVRPLLLYPLIGSALCCSAFLIWTHFEWFSMGPTAKALVILVVPFYLVAVAIAGFVASLSLVYVVRFVLETFWKREPRLTNLVGFVPAAVLLGFTVWGVQASVRRSAELSAATSATTGQEVRQKLLKRAISRHDVGVMSLLARNPQTSTTDLSRIYAVCQRTLSTHSSRDYEVFYSLAQNPHTPAKILSKLATSEESSTRVEVALNPATPEDSLQELADDRDDSVRTWLTHNPKAPLKLLKQLSHDRDGVTRNHAKSYLAARQPTGIK